MKIKLTSDQTDEIVVKEVKRVLLFVQESLDAENDRFPGIMDFTDAEEYLEDVQLQRGCVAILRYYMLRDDADLWMMENRIG